MPGIGRQAVEEIGQGWFLEALRSRRALR